MDKHFRVEVIEQMPNPQRLVWAAMHQDYSEGFVWDSREQWPEENKAGNLVVKHLLQGHRGHYGPLEHPQIALNVGGFPHSTMQQLRTHRVGVSFDVQCLSGSTIVTFQNKYGHASKKLKKTMSDLYDLWTNGESALRSRRVKTQSENSTELYRRDTKARLKKMRVRSLDEETNQFTSNHIEDVVFTGFNPVYKVTLEDGKTLECTQNHKIYTPYGWRVLAQLSVGMNVMVNGQPSENAATTYQNKEWLQTHFSKGLKPKDLAALAGCSVESIKKWAYIHKLTWTKTQWNKGIKYNIDISEQERERRRSHARQINESRKSLGLIPSGANHPSWKNLPPEKRVYNWLRYKRQDIIRQQGGKCRRCGSTKKLHCHHIETVRERPDLAFELSNIEVLCASCHSKHHHKGTTNPLCSHPVKIKSIEYKGVEPTYDLVMKSPHHNFVANGIVVHNSFRYTGERLLKVADAILRDPQYEDYTPGICRMKPQSIELLESVIYLRPVGAYTDRQGKRYDYTWQNRLNDLALAGHCITHYCRNIESGLSEEHARGLIPFDVRQNFVLSCNLRSLMHLLVIRGKDDCQLEIIQLCELILPHFQSWAAQVYEWFVKNQWKRGRLAP